MIGQNGGYKLQSGVAPREGHVEPRHPRGTHPASPYADRGNTFVDQFGRFYLDWITY